MKDTFYFSHDYNCRSDEKIKRLIRAKGMIGYGIFWAIIEDLYNNANALRTDYDGIAFDLYTDSETIKSVINDFDLFVIEDGNFSSISVSRRIGERDEKSEKARQSAFKRWNKLEPDANALQSESEGNAIKEIKETKRKKVYTDDFSLFYSAYPKKKSIDDAFKAWQKKKDKPDIAFILEKLELQKKSEDWQKDNGQFIPYPATYINRGAWHDEIIKPAHKFQDTW